MLPSLPEGDCRRAVSLRKEFYFSGNKYDPDKWKYPAIPLRQVMIMLSDVFLKRSQVSLEKIAHLDFCEDEIYHTGFRIIVTVGFK